VLERPEPEPDFPQHLCLDKGTTNDTGWEATVDHGTIRTSDDSRRATGRPTRHKARRWVWNGRSPSLSKCAGLLTAGRRCDNYLGSSTGAPLGSDASTARSLASRYDALTRPTIRTMSV